MTDVKGLKQCIQNSGMTIVFIARETGILRETLYNRMNSEKADFKASEITALANVLGLTTKERDEIFFAEECELNSQ